MNERRRVEHGSCPSASSTLVQLIAQARERLLAGGVPPDEAPGDAEVLARHVLGWDLTRYATGRSETPPADFAPRYDASIARRLTREPVSQIVGHREFWGLDFEVTRDVLTPRPETEMVVQAALDVCADIRRADPPLVIADIGTGSGCIAIALATHLPRARFVASDVSAAALAVARRNAERHGVTRQIAFVHTEAIPPEDDVDLVVSNPPYIPVGVRASLPPEVRDYEPDTALFAGADGLDVYRHLFRNIAGGLPQNGRMIVEVGYDQAPAVKAIADTRFWSFERSYRDLQGIERVLVFRVGKHDQ